MISLDKKDHPHNSFDSSSVCVRNQWSKTFPGCLTQRTVFQRSIIFKISEAIWSVYKRKQHRNVYRKHTQSSCIFVTPIQAVVFSLLIKVIFNQSL